MEYTDMKAGDVILLTVSDVTSVLNVSRDFVYREIASRALSAIRLGKALRVKPKDLESYIEKRRG